MSHPDPDSNRYVDTVLEYKNNLQKSEPVACYEVFYVLFGGLKASTVAWKFLWRPKQLLEPDPDPVQTLPSQKVKF
jgi:hypothetical protein